MGPILLVDQGPTHLAVSCLRQRRRQGQVRSLGSFATDSAFAIMAIPRRMGFASHAATAQARNAVASLAYFAGAISLTGVASASVFSVGLFASVRS
jgi:hypothetical protein